MYSLTFRVRVTTPLQYGRNRTAHAACASILLPARGVDAGMRSVRVRHAWGVWWARWITAELCHAFPQCCHSNATRAPIANPPDSTQLGASPTTTLSYIRVRAIVWACGRGQSRTQTHRRAWPQYISRGLRLTRNVTRKRDKLWQPSHAFISCNCMQSTSL